MKRAKQRKFRHPVWFRFVPSSTTGALFKQYTSNGVFPLLTGELGHVDCGTRFILSPRGLI